jgi:hypothetical protein
VTAASTKAPVIKFKPEITRVAKFRVDFPDRRKPDMDTLAAALYETSQDLTLAANRTLTHLWAIYSGVIPHPINKKGLETHQQTLANQIMSGKVPGAIVRQRHPVHSQIVLAAANLVHTRASKDFRNVLLGKQALPTFRGLPILFRKLNVTLTEYGIKLNVWPSRAKVIVAPMGTDSGTAAILRRLRAGEIALVDGSSLFFDDRKKHWMLALCWQAKSSAGVQSRKNLIAGVDIGRTTAAVISYVTLADVPEGYSDRVHLPGNVPRGWRRLEAMRRARGRGNRAVFASRAGRGVGRKVRATTKFGEKHANLSDTGVAQVAAAVVDAIKRRGAAVLAIENLTGWATAKGLAELPDATNRQRARRRRWHFEFLHGKLRTALRVAAEAANLIVIEVDAAYTSRTCSSCGTRYVAPVGGFGRLTQASFVCRCGVSMNADKNAAINIAKRGLVAYGKWAESMQAASK